MPQPDAPLPECSSDESNIPLDDDTITAIDEEVDARMAQELMTVAETKCRWTIEPTGPNGGTAINQAGTIWTLSDMQRGWNANGQVLAARAQYKKLYVKFLIKANSQLSGAQFARIIIFIDKQNIISDVFNVAINQYGLLDNFFEPVTRGERSFLAHRNFLGIDYTHFLHDEVVSLHPGAEYNYNGIFKHIHIPLHKWRTTFDASGDGFAVTNCLRMAIMSNVPSGGEPPTVEFTAALEYTDA